MLFCWGYRQYFWSRWGSQSVFQCDTPIYWIYKGYSRITRSVLKYFIEYLLLLFSNIVGFLQWSGWKFVSFYLLVPGVSKKEVDRTSPQIHPRLLNTTKLITPFLSIIKYKILLGLESFEYIVSLSLQTLQVAKSKNKREWYYFCPLIADISMELSEDDMQVLIKITLLTPTNKRVSIILPFIKKFCPKISLEQNISTYIPLI